MVKKREEKIVKINSSTQKLNKNCTIHYIFIRPTFCSLSVYMMYLLFVFWVCKYGFWCMYILEKPGPAVIKLFESENELKCKNCLLDFIETLCLISNF